MRKLSYLLTLAFNLFTFLLFAQPAVDKFTGDFQYTLPLTSVAAPNGPPIPITLIYHGGIQVEQRASEVGLGWSLSAGGSIKRQVSGFPDDCNGGSLIDDGSLTGAFGFTTSYGVIYYDQDIAPRRDVYRHFFKLDSVGTPALIPDYDHYMVSGPGMGGEIEPRFWEYYDLGYFPETGHNDPVYKPQFQFKHDFSDTLEHRYFKWEDSPVMGDIMNALEVSVPGVEIGSPSSDRSYEGGAFNNENHYVSANRNRLRTAKYIEYFTNSQIENYKSSPGEYPINGGFIEYGSSVTRSTSGTNGSLIGAFRITNESGFTYHYSLPAYAYAVTTAGYDLNHDYSLKDYITDKDSTGGASYLVKQDNGGGGADIPWKYREAFTHALEWMLTGITGPDFVDDGDGYLDDGDEGYWVLFNYTSQRDTLRTPYKGIEYQFSANSYDVTTFGTSPTINPWEKHVGEDKQTGRVGSFHEIDREHYLLSEIKTSTHLLSFTAADRTDEKTKRYTELILTEREEDTMIRKVKFIQDYRLAPGYYRNDNVYLSNTGFLDSPALVQSGASYSRNTTSGKLTLNAVNFSGVYEDYNLHPDYLFYYNHTSTSDNPDYNPLKSDYWGYYKSDAGTSGLKGYRRSMNEADAWSLRSIVAPQGDSISIIYESDEYKDVISEAHYGGDRGPAVTFAIASVDTVGLREGIDWKVILETGQADFEDIVNEVGDNNGFQKASIIALVPFTLIDSSCYETVDVGHTFLRSFYDHRIDFDDIMTGNPNTLLNMSELSSPLSYMPLCSCSTGTCVQGYYLGNGYIRFQFDEGWIMPGGDIRVKELRTSNGPGETYVMKYTYEDGTATAEADPYGFSQLHTVHSYNYTLSGKFSNKYSLPLQVGYAKITEENKGINDIALGKKVYRFNTKCGLQGTDITDVEIQGIPYYQPFLTTEAVYEYNPFSYSGNINDNHLIEVIDQFSTFWGSMASEETQDINENIIQKTTYEYEHPVEGAEVEAFLYSFKEGIGTYDPDDFNYNLLFTGYGFHWPNSSSGEGETRHRFAIFREYPTRVKSVTTYSNGIETTVSNLYRDPITGAVTTSQSVGVNATEIIETSQPAFRQPAFKMMGAKSDNWKFANILDAPYMGKTYVDNNLSGTDDFISYNKVLWSSHANVREYNSTTKHYESNFHTSLPWYSDRSFAWRGPLDTFGLYNSGDLVDFHPLLAINMGWNNSFDNQNFYKYTGTPFIGINPEGGTSLTTELGTDLFALFDNETYLDDFSSLTLQTGTFLYDADDFISDFPDAQGTTDWSDEAPPLIYADDPTAVVSQGLVVPPGWRMQGRINLLDERNNVLETTDENGRIHAMKYCFDNLVNYAEIGYSNFVSFTATGFEESLIEGDSTFSEGEVSIAGCTRVLDSSFAHTGHYYLQMAASKNVHYSLYNAIPLQKGKTYRASVWVHESTDDNAYLKVSSVTSGTPISVTMSRDDADTIRVGDWILLNMDVVIPNDILMSELHVSFHTTAAGGAKIDDMRFHCVDAPLVVKVYDRHRERLMAELDNNNYATRYNYDAEGRVIEVWQDLPGAGVKRVKTVQHHFARQY